MKDETIKELKIFIRWLKQDLQENLIDNEFTGELKDSIKVSIDKGRDGYEIILEFAEHGIYLDEGTRPHFPPVDEIRPWAQAHGINEWALAKSIAEKGTKAYPWLYTFDDVEFNKKLRDLLGEGMEKDLDNWVKKINIKNE